MSRGAANSARSTVAEPRDHGSAEATASWSETPPGSAPIGLDPAGWAGTALVVAAVSMISAVMVPYPFTVVGVDARQRDMAFGLAMTLVAVGWWRRARQGGRVVSFVVATAVLAAAQFALSWVVGYGSGGALAVAWWFEKATSVVMLALCLGALISAARHTTDGSEVAGPGA